MQHYFFWVRVVGTFILVLSIYGLLRIHNLKVIVIKAIDESMPEDIQSEIKHGIIDSIKNRQQFLWLVILLCILLITTAIVGQYK